VGPASVAVWIQVVCSSILGTLGEILSQFDKQYYSFR
jgi:hypothetical protein